MYELDPHLVESPQEDGVTVIDQVVRVDVSQTVEYNQDEVSDRLHPLPPHEKDPPRPLVEERVPEAVIVIVVAREVVSEEKCHLGRADGLV